MRTLRTRRAPSSWSGAPAPRERARSKAHPGHNTSDDRSMQPERAAVRGREVVDGAAEDEADDGRELHHDVERGARGVLQRVADGVARHRVLVRLGALHELLAEAARGDVLLGVVPRAAGIAHRDGQLHTRDQSPRKQARACILPEAQAGNEGAQDHQGSRRQHLAQGRLRRDADATLVVRRHLLRTHDLRELRQALLDHVVRRGAHGLHRPSREGIGHHRAEEQASEDPRVQNVHSRNPCSHRERPEQRQAHKRRGADCEALADGRRGIPCRVEAIRQAADRLRQASHLRDAPGVVRDGAVGVDGQRHGHGPQHSKSTERHSEHATEAVRHEDRQTQAEHGNDAREVAQRQAVDDPCGRGLLLRLGDLPHRRVAVRGVVLGDEADEQAGPETQHDRHRAVPPLHLLVALAHAEGLRKAVLGQCHDDRRHQDGADHEDALERFLHARHVPHGIDAALQEQGQQADDDARGGDQDWVHQRAPARGKIRRRAREHQRRAS
mmetsp:Transcript_125122/g.361992  ORF Transcript_125122/g.361992 Transcript_125122/m.361992 type:complete len:498 (+) Transcript_125122:112-1605(+)